VHRPLLKFPTIGVELQKIWPLAIFTHLAHAVINTRQRYDSGYKFSHVFTTILHLWMSLCR